MEGSDMASKERRDWMGDGYRRVKREGGVV
jgi:hypothetical protein